MQAIKCDNCGTLAERNTNLVLAKIKLGENQFRVTIQILKLDIHGAGGYSCDLCPKCVSEITKNLVRV